MSETVTEQASSALMNVYNRFPLTLVKGKGSYVWDDEGANYLDFTSGIATCNLGHIPDSVEEAVKEQLEQLWHCSNLYHIPAQKKLAEQLVKYSCLDQVFFVIVVQKQTRPRLNWQRNMQRIRGGKTGQRL